MPNGFLLRRDAANMRAQAGVVNDQGKQHFAYTAINHTAINRRARLARQPILQELSMQARYVHTNLIAQD